jgi:hypothetical protein
VHWLAAGKLKKDLADLNSDNTPCPGNLLHGIRALVTTLRSWLLTGIGSIFSHCLPRIAFDSSQAWASLTSFGILCFDFCTRMKSKEQARNLPIISEEKKFEVKIVITLTDRTYDLTSGGYRHITFLIKIRIIER